MDVTTGAAARFSNIIELGPISEVFAPPPLHTFTPVSSYCRHLDSTTHIQPAAQNGSAIEYWNILECVPATCLALSTLEGNDSLAHADRFCICYRLLQQELPNVLMVMKSSWHVFMCAACANKDAPCALQIEPFKCKADTGAKTRETL